MVLFEPLKIRNITLKNRIVLPALKLMLGLNNPRAHEFYLERAKGGVGTIIMQGTPIDFFTDDNAWGHPGAVKKLIQGMRPFTEEIRKTGAKIGIQLWHGNRLPGIYGSISRADSKKVAPTDKNGMQALTADEIQLISEKFGQASEKAKEAGFDFVELHGAHGYLLCQFFSGADNKRTDKYGGDVYGRMRFGIDTVKTVRSAVGNDFPIFYRIGAEENLKDGVTINESRLYSVELEKAGVDVIDVSVGRSSEFSPSPSKKAKMGTYAYLSHAIKQSVNIPVVAVGRINTQEVAESILNRKKADLVAIGRQMIADPYWPKKVKHRRTDEIVACLSCNSCFGPVMGGKWKPGDPVCKVNERAGREIDIPF
jgi:2,4-dienoyl-CoA reductase (NADPH2)